MGAYSWDFWPGREREEGREGGGREGASEIEGGEVGGRKREIEIMRAIERSRERPAWTVQRLKPLQPRPS